MNNDELCEELLDKEIYVMDELGVCQEVILIKKIKEESNREISDMFLVHADDTEIEVKHKPTFSSLIASIPCGKIGKQQPLASSPSLVLNSNINGVNEDLLQNAVLDYYEISNYCITTQPFSIFNYVDYNNEQCYSMPNRQSEVLFTSLLQPSSVIQFSGKVSSQYKAEICVDNTPADNDEENKDEKEKRKYERKKHSKKYQHRRRNRLQKLIQNFLEKHQKKRELQKTKQQSIVKENDQTNQEKSENVQQSQQRRSSTSSSQASSTITTSSELNGLFNLQLFPDLSKRKYIYKDVFNRKNKDHNNWEYFGQSHDTSSTPRNDQTVSNASCSHPYYDIDNVSPCSVRVGLSSRKKVKHLHKQILI
ncbi:unnamed protein product [Didymodactylos carnosus]|uniref:Uncharacterized protein n=1 Tax=Didymodactylos carnosus TaxID=1234261 RepID=A0A814NUH9_9BILA|nr:unnamed protein product [Didymodactylos carnosus]CAF3861363.1 unnamed protein product [Didymodactylos carnosus]